MRDLKIALLLAFALHGGAAAADDASRGALLYSNHCHGCHSEQAHWREQKLVSTWDSLIAEVWRWQRNLKLDWGQAEVDAVARHLNRLHYHFPEPYGSS